MIDTLLNLMFRCSHRRLTRPVTPVAKPGAPHGDTYVVCLDCGKQFSYDTHLMQIGKPLPVSREAVRSAPETPKPRSRKWRYAFLATLPLGILIGSGMASKKRAETRRADPPNRS